MAPRYPENGVIHALGARLSFPSSFSASILDGSNGFTIFGTTESADFGISIASAGDINGDGINDLIIGQSDWAHSFTYAATYVVFGRADGFSSPIDLDNLDGSDGFRLVGGAQVDLLGGSVGGGGDINNDGFDDVIIATNGTATGGRGAIVLYGKASGFDAIIDIGAIGQPDTSVVRGAPVEHVSVVGDINGDGFDDIAVTTPYTNSVYVVFGTASGIPGSLELNSLSGANGFRVNGRAGDQIGSSVAGAGDINGDGYDDLIIGGHLANDPADPNVNGGAFVIFGKASGFTRDVNVSSLNGANGFAFFGIPGSYAGFSVASAGDFNGDGLDDILIGAPREYDSGAIAGAVYVIYGSNSGFQATYNRDSITGQNGFRIVHSLSHGLGTSVSSVGDLNGDGFEDIAVGVPYANFNGLYTGSTHVIFGQAEEIGLLALSYDGGSTSFRFDGANVGDALGRTSRSIASLGDINGDGIGDFAVSSNAMLGPGGRVGGVHIIFGQVDRVSFDGTAGDDDNSGAGAADTLSGLAGNDVLRGLGGDDIIDGGIGQDRLFGGDGNDQLFAGDGNDNVWGGEGDDELYGEFGANKLFGEAGDDILTGGTGNDRLDGGDDNDALIGGGGNDLLDGGLGTNSLSGGTGNDTYMVRSVNDTVAEAAGEGVDTIRSTISYTLGDHVENLELLSAQDRDGTGNALANRLTGNSGNNTLSGLAGNDTLVGGDGDDILIGGLGKDTLTGGLGADTFRYLQESIGLGGSELDNITDFSTAEGDRFDFSAIDADSGEDGDQAFVLAENGFTKTAGEMFVFYTASQDQTVIRLDVDGDGKADLQLRVGGEVTGDTAGWLL
jgi:hypothetical protein